jgi:hypothetical protein
LQKGISTGKSKIYTLDDSKHCSKNESNTIITAPRRHNHRSGGANKPSDIGVIVNINAEFKLMAVNPVIEYASRDVVPEYYQSLVSNTGYTVPPCLSNSSLVTQIGVYLAHH